jgi:hypothetical protein
MKINIMLFLVVISFFTNMYTSNLDWVGTGGATSMTGQTGDDNAGYSVAISSDGTIVAVGEPRWDGGLSNEGRVRVYKLEAGVWTETGGATAMAGQDLFSLAGHSVAISSDGTRVAVGAPFWNAAGQSQNGRVRVYQYSGSDWIEIGSPTAMTGDQNSQAGWSVAISFSGTRVAVGAPQWDGVGGSLNDSGRVRVYELGFPEPEDASISENNNEFRIRNQELAAVCYKDISYGTTPGRQTNPAGVGQGAVFSAYHIMVKGR